jgi:hypothetical protein
MILECYIKQKVCENGNILNIASFFLLIVAGLAIFIAGLGLAVFFLPCVVLGIGAVALISPVVGSYVAFKYLLKKIAQKTCWDQKQHWSLCHAREYVQRYVMNNTIGKSLFFGMALVAFSALFLLMLGLILGLYFCVKSCVDLVRYAGEGLLKMSVIVFKACFPNCFKTAASHESGLPAEQKEEVFFQIDSDSVVSREEKETAASHESGLPAEQKEEVFFQIDSDSVVSREEKETFLLDFSSLEDQDVPKKKKVRKNHNVIAITGSTKKAPTKRCAKNKSFQVIETAAQ